jgi:carbon-monoxide dehydrogenase small subunit
MAAGKYKIVFTLNNSPEEAMVNPGEVLVDLLREAFGLTGTKKGCGIGECGACTVLLNGKPVNSCLVLAASVDGKSITTIEGIEGDTADSLREAFVDEGAVQCGYCTPGMIVSAKALLDSAPDPSDSEIKKAISGNICRCTGYARIVAAIRKAAATPSAGNREKDRS